VIEAGEVVMGCGTTGDHLVDLGVQFLLDLGVLTQFMEKPGERGGGVGGAGWNAGCMSRRWRW
jgi:hypothetical protein